MGVERDFSRRASRRRWRAAASGSEREGEVDCSRDGRRSMKRGATSAAGDGSKDCSILDRMWETMLPRSMVSAFRRAGLSTSLRSLGSEAEGAMVPGLMN